MRFVALVVTVLMLAPNLLHAAGSCSAASGDKTIALMELYTSEGCNSCPPADAWLSALNKKGYRSDRIVPLALHVDYWDYIGWKDPFAQAAFTDRQREASRRSALNTIYTPQLVFNGITYRRWSDDRKLDLALDIVNNAKPRATIVLNAQPAGARANVDVEVNVTDVKERTGAKLFLAVYENNLVSNVKAGENRGVRLGHDHVVRQWIGPIALDAAGKATVTREVNLSADWKRKDLGVVAFVESGDSGEVLQALALPGCL